MNEKNKNIINGLNNMKIKEVLLTGFGHGYITKIGTCTEYDIGYRVKYIKDNKISQPHFRRISVPEHILPEQRIKYFKLSIMKLYNGI